METKFCRVGGFNIFGYGIVVAGFNIASSVLDDILGGGAIETAEGL